VKPYLFNYAAAGRSFILRGQNKQNQTKGQPMLALRIPSLRKVI